MSLFKKKATRAPENKGGDFMVLRFAFNEFYSGTELPTGTMSLYVMSFATEAAAIEHAKKEARARIDSGYVVVRVTCRVKATTPPVTVTDVATCRSLP